MTRRRTHGVNVRLVTGSDYDRAGGSGAVRAVQRRLADLRAAPGGVLMASRVEGER